MRYVLFVFFSGALFSQQSGATAATMQKKIDELTDRLKKAEAQILKLTVSSIANDGSIKDLFERLEGIPPESVNFDTGDSGHLLVRSKAGPIAIALGAASEYPGGHKIEILAMPLAAVVLNDVDITIRHGAKFDKKTMQFSKWDSSLKETVSSNNNLSGGKWNKVSVVLAGAKTDEMQYFEISIEYKGIRPLL